MKYNTNFEDISHRVHHQLKVDRRKAMGPHISKWWLWKRRYETDFTYQTRVNMIIANGIGFIVGIGLTSLIIKVILMIADRFETL